MNTQKLQQGFSFILLIVLVAIIGTLAYFAIPAYQDYMTKSQWTEGFTQISKGKVGISTRLNDNADAVVSPIDIGLATATENCSLITSSSASGTGAATIACTHIGGSGVGGLVTTLVRTASGIWSCSTTSTIAIAAERCK